MTKTNLLSFNRMSILILYSDQSLIFTRLNTRLPTPVCIQETFSKFNTDSESFEFALKHISSRIKLQK